MTVYPYQLPTYKERESQREREDQREKGWTDIQTYSRQTASDTQKEKKVSPHSPVLSILLRWPFGLVNLSPGNRDSLSTTATPLRTCS